MGMLQEPFLFIYYFFFVSLFCLGSVAQSLNIKDYHYTQGLDNDKHILAAICHVLTTERNFGTAQDSIRVASCRVSTIESFKEKRGFKGH